MEGQNDKQVMGDRLAGPIPTKKVPALSEQELSIFFLMDLFTL
jgi:hypothetical protein